MRFEVRNELWVEKGKCISLIEWHTLNVKFIIMVYKTTTNKLFQRLYVLYNNLYNVTCVARIGNAECSMI